MLMGGPFGMIGAGLDVRASGRVEVANALAFVISAAWFGLCILWLTMREPAVPSDVETGRRQG